MSLFPDVLPMPPGLLEGRAAWYGPDLEQRRDWIYEFDARDKAEIDDAVRAVRAANVPFGEISPATFPLPTLGAKLAAFLEEVLHGRGFVLIRGFPTDRYTLEETAAGYLGIGSYFGPFRSQNAKGHLLGHVKDLGYDIKDPTTRYYQTTRQLDYHTDSADLVGLICLKPSKSGGESRIVSSVTMYNEILRRRPDLLPELFHPFATDRRGEIPAGMLPWFDAPVFQWFEGELTTIYSGQYIRSAQVNFPELPRLTAKEIEALDYFDALSDAPDLRLQMEFRPGDIQLINNHTTLHSRTDFENWPEPERHRHLLRLWIAPLNARPLPEWFAPRYGSTVQGQRGGIVTAETTLKFVLEAE